MSVSLTIKKTAEAPKPETGAIQDGYEELRAYALSPLKAVPLRLLGLDLWNKKGFLAWSLIAFHHNPPAVQVNRIATETLDVPSALVVPLTNIINDWSNRYAGSYEF